jgi:hypothetical protein
LKFISLTSLQGEWFFIPKPELNTKELVAIFKYSLLHNRRAGQEAHHYATEAGYKKKGNEVFARGTIRHTGHDHPMLKLGKVWHKVIESNHVQSFGARGRID